MHQCVHCGKLYPDGSQALLSGCENCKSHFFFYVKDEVFERLKEEHKLPVQIPESEKKRVEKDIRDIIGLEEEKPIILDIESIRIIKKGKFELDIVKLLKKELPIVYKIDEGKYIIDLSSLMKIKLPKVKKSKKEGK